MLINLKKDNYINEVLNETAEENPNKLTDVTVVGANDDWDDGLTFTAKSSRKYRHFVCLFFNNLKFQSVFYEI